MNKIIHEIKLDFSLPCAKKHVYSSRLDAGSRELCFTLTNDGEPYLIDGNASVYLYAVLSGGTRVFEECTFSGNTVTAPLTSNMTDCCTTLLGLRITTPDGCVLTSPTVTLHNLSSVISDDALMAEDEFPALLEAIQKADGLRITSVEQVNGELIFTYADGEYVTVSLEELRGPAGADGDDGENGKSAYAYAQDGGYTGTEEEFAVALANAASGGNAPAYSGEVEVS